MWIWKHKRYLKDCSNLKVLGSAMSPTKKNKNKNKNKNKQEEHKKKRKNNRPPSLNITNILVVFPQIR